MTLPDERTNRKTALPKAISVKLSDEILTELDERVGVLKTTRGPGYGRSDLVRELIIAGLKRPLEEVR